MLDGVVNTGVEEPAEDVLAEQRRHGEYERDLDGARDDVSVVERLNHPRPHRQRDEEAGAHLHGGLQRGLKSGLLHLEAPA